jgi:hypothetical protein
VSHPADQAAPSVTPAGKLLRIKAPSRVGGKRVAVTLPRSSIRPITICNSVAEAFECMEEQAKGPTINQAARR